MQYDFSLLLAELLVVLAGTAILAVDAWRSDPEGHDESGPRSYSWVSAAVLFGAAAWILMTNPRGESFLGLFVVDAFAAWVKVLALVGGGLGVLLLDDWLGRHRFGGAAAHALLLFSTSGMMFAVSAGDLVTLFLGIEVMSIPAYCLAAANRWDDRSVEAGVKYLVLGSFAAGVMLYGMGLLYGFQGMVGHEPSTSLLAIRQALVSTPEVPGWASFGGLLLLAGLLFKVGAVPFHMWVPDVYEGAPTPVTAWMSAAIKTAAFAVILRLFAGKVVGALHLEAVLWVVAAMTMVVGNVMALGQDNVKRMLAYSSIAHAGYMLLGLLAGSRDGQAGILYYLAAYTGGTVLSFGVLLWLARAGHEVERFEDLRGLGQRYPWAGVGMVLAMLSLMGIPPLAGFFGKFQVFYAAVQKGYIVLAVLGVLTSAVSVAYYLRPILALWVDRPIETAPAAPGRAPLWVGLALAALLVLGLGLVPSPVLEMAEDATLAGR
jgi:NADH-quinone oxidoreductase subunit N